MKRLLLIILLVFPLSCYDGLGDMLDEVTMEVPVCVWDAAPGPVHDGRGWKNAYTTLADAVAAADEGETIWVAGTQNIASTVTISKPLTILGGFSGIESRRDQRDVDNNKAELQGTPQLIQKGGTGEIILDGFSVRGGTGSSIIIQEGTVYVKNCFFGNGHQILVQGQLYAEACEFKDRTIGHHIYLDGGSFTAENCIFTNNHAANEPVINAQNNSEVVIKNSVFNNNSTSSGSGGAIHANSSTIVISRSKFGDKAIADSGNTAIDGGAIYADSSTVTISDNTEFYRNSATSTGGAIYATGSTVTITGSLFGDEFTADSGNSAVLGGGAIRTWASSSLSITGNAKFFRNKVSSSGAGGAIELNSSDLTVDGCIFGGSTAGSGNIAQRGGAISTHLGVATSSLINISNNIFIGNSAYIESLTCVGGAIWNFQCEWDINSCFFSNNNSKDGGGAVYSNGSSLNIVNSEFIRNTAGTGGSRSGGGVYVEAGGTTIINSLFNKNEASNEGGAIYSRITVYLRNSTLTGNHAGATLSQGGGIYLADASADLYAYNSVIWGNTASGSGSGYNINTYPNAFIQDFERCYYDGGVTDSSGNPDLSNSDNSVTNPFQNSSDENNSFYLRPNSMLIDQGDNSYLDLIMYSTDLAGNPRFKGGAIDIGAYERQ